MTMNSFRPDYAVPPGDTLAEWLEERGMKQAELAARINMSEKALSQIINGAAPLTRATASKLELATGIPARTWNNLEALYQDDQERLTQLRALEAQTDFLADLPIAQLRKLRVLTAPTSDKPGLLRQALEFFGVADPDSWRRLWLGPQAAALKQSQAFKVDPAAVAAWLRLGELEADKVEVAEFDSAKLRTALQQIRRLTREEDPDVFSEEIGRIAADCGVAVVFVPEVKGARCSGAMRWVHGRPIVQLSLRFGSDDHFWFALFHELAHVVLHGRKEVFISDGETNHAAYGEKETEADQFARDLLIPRSVAAELPNLLSLEAITKFAERIGVAPGIVVGRLHHDRILPPHVGKSLKKPLRLEESPRD